MTLYKRQDSPYWWMRFSPIKGELKPLQKSTGTANKRQAQQLHDKLKAERWEVDKLDHKPKRTWDDAVEKWIEETAANRNNDNDRRTLALLHPLLGGKGLTDINRALLDEIRAKRAKLVKLPTVNRNMALIRAVLNRACHDWEWIDRVPKVGMYKQAEGRIRSLNRDEFSKLLRELPPHLADMAMFSVATGLRRSNVTQLKWAQVSLERRHLWVAGKDHKNGVAHSVPLNEPAMQVLDKRKGDHPIYVFVYEGKPVYQVSTKAWQAALKRAGIEDFRWHDLRHTFATWHREAGTPTHELQRLGGWKTQSMVERYAHLSPQGLQSAAARLDNVLPVTY